jgi:hypothetical protein
MSSALAEEGLDRGYSMHLFAHASRRLHADVLADQFSVIDALRP